MWKSSRGMNTFASHCKSQNDITATNTVKIMVKYTYNTREIKLHTFYQLNTV